MLLALKYYKLFDLLLRRGMKKTDLYSIAGISSPTLAKLSKGQSINSDIIDRLCATLSCQPGDIMEYVPYTQDEEGTITVKIPPDILTDEEKKKLIK